MVEGLRERETLRAENVGLLEDLRRQADELAASRARIVATSDATRRKVERELHEGAQQNLAILKLKLGQLRKAVGNGPAAALADETQAELDRALAVLGDFGRGIYPQVLISDGLAGALAEAVAKSPVAVDLDSNGAGRYPPALEGAVYFCCLEALQNAAQHAGAGAHATVRLDASEGELRFEVADDGAGFDTAASNGGTGLQDMADRIGALGGTVAIESRPGEGTVVSGSVPVGD